MRTVTPAIVLDVPWVSQTPVHPVHPVQAATIAPDPLQLSTIAKEKPHE